MVMLYVVRHGIAEEPKEGQKDEERALTPEGIKKFRKTARGFVRMLGKDGLGLILTSPLVRALQTSAILEEVLEEERQRVEVKVHGGLVPGGERGSVLKSVHAAKTKAVAIVGHEPGLSTWIGEICFGKAGRLLLKKGAVAALALNDSGDTGELQWLLQPGTLRGLASRKK